MQKRTYPAILFLFVVAFASAQAPKKILTQSVLEKFLADMPAIMEQSEVTTALEISTQEALMESITNPNSQIMRGQTVFSDIFTMQRAIYNRIKGKKEVQDILAKKNWKENFWDVFLVVMIGLPYAHLQEIKTNPELAAFTLEINETDMPPSSTYIHADDLALIQKNLSRIKLLMEDEALMNTDY